MAGSDAGFLSAISSSSAFLRPSHLTQANRSHASLSKSLALLPLTLRGRSKEGRKYQEDVNEKDLFDRSNSVVVVGLGCGADYTQFTAAGDTGCKLSIVNLTQPAAQHSR